MDLAQLRKRAKDLLRAVADGEPDGIDRVLRFHPKLAGRPNGLEGVFFGLRDAQATLARELGFDGWQALLTAARSGRDEPPAWVGQSRMFVRAFEQASRHGDSVVSGRHVLLALLHPPSRTVALEVLLLAGARSDPDSEPADESHSASSSIPLHHLDGFATALALASGAAEPTDEQILIALIYEHRHGSSTVASADLDPDEIYELLLQRNIPLPAARPAPLPPPDGPPGPRVYVHGDYAQRVTRILSMHHPPGTRSWGVNHSRWKPGWVWFDAEEQIGLPDLASHALEQDTTLMEVVPFTEAVRHEAVSPLPPDSP